MQQIVFEHILRCIERQLESLNYLRKFSLFCDERHESKQVNNQSASNIFAYLIFFCMDWPRVLARAGNRHTSTIWVMSSQIDWYTAWLPSLKPWPEGFDLTLTSGINLVFYLYQTKGICITQRALMRELRMWLIFFFLLCSHFWRSQKPKPQTRSSL